MYILAKIHNSRLGTVLSIDTEEQGKEIIRQWVKNQFNRNLTEEEEELLENELEFYNDSDADNVYTFSIGIVES